MMKSILCFGDSNTHGTRPDGGRFARHERWTGILQTLLGEAYHVIEEGLGGRTTVWDDPIEEDKNGKQHLRTCLASHSPLDLVVIMLGTNDLKNRFSVSPTDIQWAMDSLIKTVRALDVEMYGKTPEVLIVAPVQIGRLSALADVLIGAQQKCAQLPALYEQLAATRGVYYMNAGAFAQADDGDGVHIGAAGQRALAEAFARKIQEIFEGR